MPQNSESTMYIGIIILLLLCLCSSCFAIIGVSVAYGSVQAPSADTCKTFITSDSCKDKCDCADKCPDPSSTTCAPFITSDSCKDKCGTPASDSATDFLLDFSSYTRNPNKVCRASGATDATDPKTAGVLAQNKGIITVASCKKACDDDTKCNCFDMTDLTYKDGVASGTMLGSPR